MKIALAGIGKIARDQHVPAIAGSSDWDLGATVSRSGSVEGVPSFTSLAEMFEAHPEVEVVSLCMPPKPRFDYAAEVIRAGRHVMLEKPPGATLSECHILRDMAAAAGVSIYATWHSRQAAQVAAAKAWLAERALRHVTVIWKEDVRRWHPGQDWVFEAGGLGVFDPGINGLSILTEILPDPVHLRSAELLVPENRQAPIAARLAFHHTGGAQISAEFDWRQEGEELWTIEVETEDGAIRLSEGGASLHIDGKEVAQVDGAANDGEYPQLYSQMAMLVREGRSEMDLRPLALVADAFLLGERRVVAPFEF
ncbi:D-galactose 1-dehydrogenase [Poseidonocella pacifica]|uniref:D-galactose 1-dehydrogenase n=1 Tax=Poseidonocella pacifica TaxID=871651 RepID=A0A1I0X9F0_9RHOB|nr:Gfo/Idh/MocA family oxidoreductase [Poseidonocella pacifica]SFA97561.1 D-galactose 1-dehydrogenase [Poseidonocella pacifica]